MELEAPVMQTFTIARFYTSLEVITKIHLDIYLKIFIFFFFDNISIDIQHMVWPLFGSYFAEKKKWFYF